MKFKVSNKIFAHIDCDSFFSSCEAIRNPKLKGKKVIVGYEIVLACSYEVKALGFKTGSPIWEVKKVLGNDGYFFLPDIGYYQQISNKMMNYLKYNTLLVEEFSIDEAFCEISGLAEMNKLSLLDYLKFVQADILNKIGIPVSIGVSNTRIKAKIFSKINKPYGIFISLNNSESKRIFESLALKEIPFIGRQYQERLKYRAETVYDYINIGFWKLKKIIGKTATDLWLELVGVNAFVVKKSKETKSMSRGRSFNKNITNNVSYLHEQIIENFNYLYEEFIQKEYELKTVGIFFRNKEFITTKYEFSFDDYTTSRTKILRVIDTLFYNHMISGELYRSTGILFSKFRSYKPYQMNLFEKPLRDDKHNLALAKTLNSLNAKYGDHKISFGFSILNKKQNVKLGIRK